MTCGLLLTGLPPSEMLLAGSMVACKRKGTQPGLLVIEPSPAAADPSSSSSSSSRSSAWRLHFLAQRTPTELLGSYLRVRGAMFLYVYVCACVCVCVVCVCVRL